MHWCVIYVPTLIRRRTGAAGFVVTTGREFKGLWLRFSNGPGASATDRKNRLPRLWLPVVTIVSIREWVGKTPSFLRLRQRKESIALCAWTAGRSTASESPLTRSRRHRRPTQLLLDAVHDFLEVNRLGNEGKTTDASLVGSNFVSLDRGR